jgi:hypothetical protein
MCVDLGCGTPVLVFLKNVGGKVVQYSGILPNTEVVCPSCPQCPSAPHSKFRKKRFIFFFVAWKCMTQKDISGRGGSRGTGGARPPLSDQEGYGGRPALAVSDQPHWWQAASSRVARRRTPPEGIALPSTSGRCPPPDMLNPQGRPVLPSRSFAFHQRREPVRIYLGSSVCHRERYPCTR